MWPADAPNATEASVWRSVPSVLNVALTAPYQLDGRAATLEDQALGALHGHAEIKHDPNPKFLSDVADFQKGLFSSVGVASVATAIANGETPPNPDPALTPFETQGKALFGGFCANCHGGPTQTRPLPPFADRQNVLISKPLPPPAAGITFLPSPLAPRFWTFRLPNGATQTVPSTDPGKALISGKIADLNQFDVPSLYGISKSAPYFHDNSAATLEQVLTQYIGFFQFLQRIPPPPGLGTPPVLTQPQADAIVAYLRKIEISRPRRRTSGTCRSRTRGPPRARLFSLAMAERSNARVLDPGDGGGPCLRLPSPAGEGRLLALSAFVSPHELIDERCRHDAVAHEGNGPESLQALDRPFETGNLFMENGETPVHGAVQILDALPRFDVVSGQHAGDVLEAKAKLLCPANRDERSIGLLLVDAVSGPVAGHCAEEPGSLIEAKRLDGQAGTLRELADAHPPTAFGLRGWT